MHREDGGAAQDMSPRPDTPENPGSPKDLPHPGTTAQRDTWLPAHPCPVPESQKAAELQGRAGQLMPLRPTR